MLAVSPKGRHVLAIGVNAEAAFLSGINVRRTILLTFVLTGAAAGLAGVMYAMLLDRRLQERSASVSNSTS